MHIKGQACDAPVAAAAGMPKVGQRATRRKQWHSPVKNFPLGSTFQIPKNTEYLDSDCFIAFIIPH